VKKLSILLITLLVFGLLLAAGCGGGEGAKEEAEKSEAPMILDVGTDAAYAPMEYKGESGEVEGFDADLIKAI